MGGCWYFLSGLALLEFFGVAVFFGGLRCCRYFDDFYYIGFGSFWCFSVLSLFLVIFGGFWSFLALPDVFGVSGTFRCCVVFGVFDGFGIFLVFFCVVGVFVFFVFHSFGAFCLVL